jgi:L-ascorbate metabolism protein UlaG (beta-lactamase superfamily)
LDIIAAVAVNIAPFDDIEATDLTTHWPPPAQRRHGRGDGMKIDHLGHASWLCHGKEGRVLFDPLLLGVHHEGLYDVYPPRTLDPERLPSITGVVVSHAHQDHFDPASIAALPREMPIYTVHDDLILGCLEGLGFTAVTSLAPLQPFRVGSMTLVPTPGADGANEFGFLIIDEDAVVWNLVDTVPHTSTIVETRARARRIDLALTPWQPLQDMQFATGKPIQFPFEMYDTMLQKSLHLGARAIAAGACGFSAIGPAAWSNHIVFPVTRQRWMLDLAEAHPPWAGRLFAVDPGDQLTLDAGEVTAQRSALDYCRSEAYQWETLAFRPFELGFAQAETRGPAFSMAECQELVRSFFEETVCQHVAEHRDSFEWHFRWRVRQQVEVVFHDGRGHWLLDFSGDQLRITRERSPLALACSAMTAGVLVGLVAGHVSWDYAKMSGEYRHYQHHYLVDQTGLKRPNPGRLFDVLQGLLAGGRARELALTAEVERLTSEVLNQS